MPASYTIDCNRRLVVLKVVGELSEVDVRTVERELTSDPAYDADFNHILDVREGRRLIGSTAVLREMAAKPIVNPGVRRAIVTGNLLSYGLARLFQAAHDANGLADEIKIFRDFQSALEWVDAPTSDARRRA